MPFNDGFNPNENWNPRRKALSLGLLDNEDDFKDPVRFASKLGLTNSELEYQNPKSFADSVGLLDEEPEQENYLDDTFGSVTRNLPIDQPSGSVVAGGREDLYHKYSQMLEQKPESESVLENFMARRPTFANYNPSGRTKLNSAAMGIATALNENPSAGIAVARQEVEKPFERSVQDYNSEGRFVNEYAKLADSSRNRQLTSLLSQMRFEEQERVNRARERNYESLDRDRKERARRNEDKFTRETERETKRDSRDEKRLSLEERRVRELERKGREEGEDEGEKKLSPFQKSGMQFFNRERDSDKLLESLGFGGREEDTYPEELINPITGKPYTPYEISLMGTNKNMVVK